LFLAQSRYVSVVLYQVTRKNLERAGSSEPPAETVISLPAEWP
jgi:hypothetical protein